MPVEVLSAAGDEWRRKSRLRPRPNQKWDFRRRLLISLTLRRPIRGGSALLGRLAGAPVSRLLLQPETERCDVKSAHNSHLQVFIGGLSPASGEYLQGPGGPRMNSRCQKTTYHSGAILTPNIYPVNVYLPKLLLFCCSFVVFFSTIPCKVE